MSPSVPTVSIVIVCWNSASYLPRCLQALSAQTYRAFEVIIIDNGSSDDAVDCLREKYPDLDLRVERLESNLGFAAANNIGARLARGAWLALLNPDAFPKPDWLEQLMQAAGKFPQGVFFASRQYQADRPGLLDGEGDLYHVSGLAWRRNYGLPVYPLRDMAEVFSACGAAALYPRQDFLAAGGFDEDYFAYLEDVDLGFRLRLRGLTCMFVPQAVVHHVGSAATGKRSDFSTYYGHRNLVWTYVKDMPAALLWLYLPLHLAMNAFYLFSFLLKGRGRVLWRAKLDALRGLPAVLRKRRAVQRDRSATVWVVYRAMRRDLFEPLIASLRRRQPG